MLFELGVLFNLDKMDGAEGRILAWQSFMQACDPARLEGGILYAGETSETLARRENVYCIAVQSHEAEAIAHVKNALMSSEAPGLLPPSQRFLEKQVTLRYPLKVWACIDEAGRFLSWQENSAKQDRELCAKAGWNYGGVARTRGHAETFRQGDISKNTGNQFHDIDAKLSWPVRQTVW